MKPLIVANWKCNPSSLAEAKEIFSLVKKGALSNAEVVVCPPFVYLSELPSGGKINLGAQDAFWEEKGAYTGEISPSMLKNLNVKYVIVGHSERRKYQKETDEMLNKKLKAVLGEKLKPILCVENVSQIKKGLEGISKNELKDLVLAYEPVFAIGTGKPCSIEKAAKIRSLIKNSLKINVPVLYGGSVSAENAADYIRKAGFQGLLVGGASLKPKEFIGIIRNVLV